MTETKKPLEIVLLLIEKYVSFAIFLAVFILLLTGTISSEPEGYLELSLVGGFLLYFIGRLAFLGFVYTHGRRETLDLTRVVESGLSIVFFLYLLINITGGVDSSIMPILYLAVVAIATLFRASVGITALVTAIVIEISVPLTNGVFLENWSVILGHVVFLALFASLKFMLKKADIGVHQQKAQSQVEHILGNIQKEAKRFRLLDLSKSSGDAREHEKSQDISAYFEIHDVLQDILRVIAVSQDAYTAAVLWYDEVRNTLRIIEAYSSSNALTENEFSARSGILHGVVSSKTPVKVTLAKWSKNPLGYYTRSENVFALCAYPIMDSDHLYGILVVDRVEEREFGDTEKEVIELASRQIYRAIVNENLLRRLDKSQHEYFNLAEASKALSQTLDKKDVLKVGMQATRAIAPYDLGAIVIQDGIEGEYKIVACWPDDIGMEGAKFGIETNLVDWVIRNNQTMVYHDFSNLPKRPTIFMPEEKLKNVSSLFIVPLKVKAIAAGAFVMISAEQDFFTEDLQHIFEIISNQLAVSLENAEMYGQVETMAITDGLTGLYNKRFFNQRMDEIIARAERYDQKVSLMMLDIDHFKQVNDTYGHGIGDLVLKRLGYMLGDSMRKIDLVARFGGEEFVILLDSTNEEGAWAKAEALRHQVSKMVFETEIRDFSINISIGIAVFPDDARHKAELMEKADVALYNSKIQVETELLYTVCFRKN